MNEFEGKVFNRWCECGSNYEPITVVVNDRGEIFDDILLELNGKAVRITVEVLD